MLCSLLGSLIYWNNPDRIEFVSETSFHSDMKMFASSAMNINTTGCNLKQLKNEARIELDDYVFESMAYNPYDDFKDKFTKILIKLTSLTIILDIGQIIC